MPQMEAKSTRNVACHVDHMILLVIMLLWILFLSKYV